MRTIKELIRKDKKVYIYLRNKETKKKFFRDAKKEGITFEGSKKIAIDNLDDIMALLSSGVICYLGFVGRMCYGSGSKDAIRIDYEKYIKDKDDYIITKLH